MYLLNPCNCPGCTKTALSSFDNEGKIIENGGFCYKHQKDPLKAKEEIYTYINTHDKIVGLNAYGLTFSDINLTDKKFYGCNFMHCIFSGLSARGFRSRMSTFDFAVFSDCTLLESNMQFTSFAGCKFSHVLFTGSDMIQDNFNGLTSYQSSFDDSDLYNSTFIQSKLVNTSFRNCNIKKTNFEEFETANVSFKLSNTNEAIFDKRGSALFTGIKELDTSQGE